MPDESVPPPTLELLWLTSEPASLRTRLGVLRTGPVEGDRVPLPPVDLVIVEDDGPADRLIVGPDAGAGGSEPSAAKGLSLAALGWATVDAERTASEFGRAIVGDVVEETLLGARARQLDSGAGLTLILLEPATEGPLAAALARNDEGPVALYVAGRPRAPAAATVTPTAMGAGRLAWPSRTGPFVILLRG